MPEYVYYVCDENGDILFEYYNEEDAREVANKQEGYSISRKQLLTEENPYAKNAQQL
jgi:hypothetical protein